MTEGVRARRRDDVTRQVLEIGRQHLVEYGAAALSLRAVTRDLGMVSSALYRYFASRDDLLTALIIDAYDALGDATERSTAATRDHPHRCDIARAAGPQVRSSSRDR